ncbi:hypothetical protein BDV41DRAFT_10687 [Aspergillus transmontanensis]|uniref:Uncharacterized protein n=1 Tax=Aspergillus transmontanensis TaxID=1034304 RepID=A0A5N6WLD8_9EURO|nr:hypothetical protein BDV41DRAFT_10687 [Aspergillus transmontanensis]
MFLRYHYYALYSILCIIFTHVFLISAATSRYLCIVFPPLHIEPSIKLTSIFPFRPFPLGSNLGEVHVTTDVI